MTAIHCVEHMRWHHKSRHSWCGTYHPCISGRMDKQHSTDSSTQSSSLPCTPSTSFCPSHTPDNILLCMHFLLKHNNDHRYQKYFSPQRPQKLFRRTTHHTVSGFITSGNGTNWSWEKKFMHNWITINIVIVLISALSSLISIAIAERKVLPFNFPTFTEYVVNKEHDP